MDGHAFQYDQPDVAARPLFVIGDMIVRGHAVGPAEGGEMRLEHDPVAQGDIADRKGAYSNSR